MLLLLLRVCTKDDHSCADNTRNHSARLKFRKRFRLSRLCLLETPPRFNRGIVFTSISNTTFCILISLSPFTDSFLDRAHLRSSRKKPKDEPPGTVGLAASIWGINTQEDRPSVFELVLMEQLDEAFRPAYDFLNEVSERGNTRAASERSLACVAETIFSKRHLNRCTPSSCLRTDT